MAPLSRSRIKEQAKREQFVLISSNNIKYLRHVCFSPDTHDRMHRKIHFSAPAWVSLMWHSCCSSWVAFMSKGQRDVQGSYMYSPHSYHKEGGDPQTEVLLLMLSFIVSVECLIYTIIITDENFNNHAYSKQNSTCSPAHFLLAKSLSWSNSKTANTLITIMCLAFSIAVLPLYYEPNLLIALWPFVMEWCEKQYPVSLLFATEIKR